MHDDPGVRIERQEIAFEASDGATLRGVRVTGPGRPKASVILVHGYGEHCGRYDRLIQALAASRFATYAIDLRGHGVSDGDRAYEPVFARYLDDLQLVVRRAREDQAGKPCYIVGHSLGGLIAFSYGLEHQDELDGVVLLAPALQYRVKVTAPTERFFRRVSAKQPRWPLIAYVPGLRSRKRGTELTALQDPLVHHGWIRAGTLVSIQDAGQLARERAGEFKLPILTMHGEGDMVIDPEGSKALYRTIGVREGADNSLITWPEMRHELLNEVDGDQVAGVILGWLNGHYTEWREANPTGVKTRPAKP